MTQVDPHIRIVVAEEARRNGALTQSVEMRKATVLLVEVDVLVEVLDAVLVMDVDVVVLVEDVDVVVVTEKWTMRHLLEVFLLTGCTGHRRGRYLWLHQSNDETNG